VSRYEPLGRRRRAVVVPFCLLIAIDLLAVGSALLELNLVDRVAAGETVTDAELDGNDSRQAAVGFPSDDPNAATSVPPPVAPGWSVAAPERMQQQG
jgi:hypothetical protein